MTYAPARLLEVRRYMKPITGLSDSALGITPDPEHDGGYHCGWDRRRVAGDYSWSESTRDSSHKTNAARAFDIGMFPRLREFSIWLVNECRYNAPDTLDIREIIYSPDGRVVKRWDRLGKRTTGDNSHLTHTHISWFADAEDRDKTAVFKRFFGDDMNDTDAAFLIWRVEALSKMLDKVRGGPGAGEDVALVQAIKKLEASAAADQTRDAATLAAIQALAGNGGPEVAPILAAIQAEAAATRALVEQQHQAEMAELRRAFDAEKAGLVAELARLNAG